MSLQTVLMSAGSFALLLSATASAATAADSHAGLFAELDANQDGRIEASEVASPHQRLYARLIRRADANRDGALSLNEFSEGLAPESSGKPIERAANTNIRGADETRLLLLKLDTNGDSRLTRDEAPKEMLSAFDSLLEAVDADKDGQLDRIELSRAGPKLAHAAVRIVRSQDLDVTRELRQIEAVQGTRAERFDRQYDPRQALADPKQAADLFKQFDANGDGRLVVDELPEQISERMAPLLRRADRNRDGGVSQQEFVTTASRLAAFMGRQSSTPASNSSPAMMESDDKVTAESFSMRSTDTPPASKSVASRLVRRMVSRSDRNKDGVVQRNEARGRLAERFGEADINGDGQLDKNELAMIAEVLGRRLKAADAKAADRAE